MSGSVFVPYGEERDVFIDSQVCGTTNVPFDVQIGTHDIDLGRPPSKRITVRSSHTPLNPLIVEFEEQASEEQSSEEQSSEEQSSEEQSSEKQSSEEQS